MKLFVSMALLAFATTACMTIRPVAAPASFIPSRNPELVWVEHHSGEVMPVAGPSLIGDTLVGTHLGTAESVRLTLPQIRSLFARQPDRTRTTLLLAATGLIAGFVVWRATQSGGDSHYCFITPGGEFHCVN